MSWWDYNEFKWFHATDDTEPVRLIHMEKELEVQSRPLTEVPNKRIVTTNIRELWLGDESK